MNSTGDIIKEATIRHVAMATNHENNINSLIIEFN
jgi:hypothetical protein